MPGRYLLDTNAAIAALEERITLPQGSSDVEVFLSYVALGELYFGAFKSSRVEANLERIRRLAATCPAVPINDETARVYGRLKGELRRKGRPIPDNDLWIAASAVQHDLVLLARDAHFDEIEALRHVAW